MKVSAGCREHTTLKTVCLLKDRAGRLRLTRSPPAVEKGEEGKQKIKGEREMKKSDEILKEFNAAYDAYLASIGVEPKEEVRARRDRMRALNDAWREAYWNEQAELEAKKKKNVKKKESKPLPDNLKMYDNYPAVDLPRTEYIDEFIETHEEYVFSGGLIGMPMTSFDRYCKGLDRILQIVDMCRPILGGKAQYQRIIYKIRDDIADVVCDMTKGDEENV